MITRCKHCKRRITNERYGYADNDGHPLQWVRVHLNKDNCECHCIENQGSLRPENQGSLIPGVFPSGLHEPVDPLAQLLLSSLPEEPGSSKAAADNRPT